MRREEEVQCKKAFDSFLLRHASEARISWASVREECEPPDFFLDYMGSRFAVEVTSLMEQVASGPQGTMPLLTVLFGLTGLVAEVEATALREGSLSGYYGVAFGDPFDNWSKVRPRLKSDLLAYIRSSANLSQAPEHTIYRQHLQGCSITKLGEQPTRVQSVQTGAKCLEGTGSEIAGLLQAIMLNKQHKLQKVPWPKILLIHDLYGYGSEGLANPQVRRACRSQVSIPNAFHTVFIVQEGRPGFVLWSQDPNWGESTQG